MEKPRQILVVEDEIMQSLLLTTILTRMGYSVEIAYDGIAALKKVKSSPPDLILLDLNLPRMDGYEVARRLKRDHKTKIIPIVVVSAFSEVENRLKAFEAGADDFLSKPIDQVEIQARVQSLLKVKMFNDHMVNYQKNLDVEVSKRTRQMRQAFEEINKLPSTAHSDWDRLPNEKAEKQGVTSRGSGITPPPSPR